MNSNLFHLADEMCVCVHSPWSSSIDGKIYYSFFTQISFFGCRVRHTHTHIFLWSKSLLHIMMAISSSFIRFVRKKGIIFHWSNYLLTSSLNNSDRSGDRHIGGLNDREVLTGKKWWLEEVKKRLFAAAAMWTRFINNHLLYIFADDDEKYSKLWDSKRDPTYTSSSSSRWSISIQKSIGKWRSEREYTKWWSQ